MTRQSWTQSGPILVLTAIAGLLGCATAPNPQATPQGVTPTAPRDLKPRRARSERLPQRSAVATALKWRLDHLFPTLAAWRKDIAKQEKLLGEVPACRGALLSSAGRLRKCLDLVHALRKAGIRIWIYARGQRDQDMRVGAAKVLLDRADKLRAAIRAALAFVDPELLAADHKALGALGRDPQLAIYDRFLAQLHRRRAHVLDRAGEALLAKLGPGLKASARSYRSLSSELPFPKVTLADGRRVRLSFAVVGRYQRHRLRRNRVAVLEGLLKTYAKQRRTFASLLSGHVTGQLAVARARRFGGAKAAPASPPSLLMQLRDAGSAPRIYHTMIKQVRAHRHLAHRWNRIRRRVLGLTKLTSYDGISIMPKAPNAYPYQRGLSIVAAALRPMGKTYLARWRLATAPGAGWIDALPNRGKWPANYIMLTTGQDHPYVLLNYRGDYQSLSLLAHETGHAMHNAFSNAAQPYPRSRPPSFVYEIASLVNEALLVEHLVSQAKTRAERLVYVGRHIGQFLSKVFRMARYAELELRIHQRVSKAGGISADELDRISLSLRRDYLGHAEGVVSVDDAWATEWAFIPHLYRSFVLYAYATSFVTATAVARKIMRDGFGPRYLEDFLKAGGSKSPQGLMGALGIDLTDASAYTAAFAVMKQRLDQLEKLLGAR